MTLTAEAERDAALDGVAANAGSVFLAKAMQFTLGYLSEHPSASGEDITLACKAAGIIPHDDRAFGHVYRRLSKFGQIEKCGFTPRKRGHLTSGGNVWRLAAHQEEA